MKITRIIKQTTIMEAIRYIGFATGLSLSRQTWSALQDLPWVQSLSVEHCLRQKPPTLTSPSWTSMQVKPGPQRLSAEAAIYPPHRPPSAEYAAQYPSRQIPELSSTQSLSFWQGLPDSLGRCQSTVSSAVDDDAHDTTTTNTSAITNENT
eukprot:TRINITY_DN6925_c0_g1_i1.p2 TRINITY_DN6925_c0_g1~~TRINITY_DN6925_c0_g1_i1.p2  ORF type:complete len:151 (+),score=12.63 TRINITY_DN6925_c0_g1_i1:59-511(+)